jgi:RNA polymerase sigma factor (sigma-70 family)
VNAVTDFVGREWSRLVAYVRGWLEDSADRDAEDVVQDVLTGMFERPDTAAPVTDVSAYVYQALRNRVVDAYRARRRTVSLDAAAGPAAEDAEGGGPPLGRSLHDVLGDMRFEAAAESEKAALRDRLFAAIDSLPPQKREIVVATELEGRPYRELAEEWDEPIGTLLARKHRAVRELRKALLKEEANE